MRRTLLLLWFIGIATPALAAAADLASRYDDAMRLYRTKNYAKAAPAFRAIVDADEKDPLTLKSRYFLARALMKSGSWADAQKQLFAIYETSSSFYAEWGCDFLLGECRKALGEDR